ncbi:FAD-dependent monooxygenase [Pseudonocardia sp. CA-107938]|uniref:FAD-dependent monooxygenase n=1 Tax=Pseudonocardia sp. CA-107938 TaxID=3240021 RepID=UPI003D8D5B94
MRDEEVGVLVVGGGPVGLTAAMLLKRLGVDVLAINKGFRTSDRPKAHMLNQRSMEIFTELGLAEAIYVHSAPPDRMATAAWYAGFAGPDPDHGRLIGKIPAWGEGYRDPDYVAASPCRTANLPQLRLEPLLHQRAVELVGADRIRFGHELLSLEQDADQVTALVRDLRSGAEFAVRARYLVAADGGRTVGRSLGIGMTGTGDLARVTTVHFTADLSPWAPDDDAIIHYLVNPAFGRSVDGGVLQPVGPRRWGPDSEEWSISFGLRDGESYDEASVVPRLRAMLGLPDLDLQVQVVSTWTIAGAVADRFAAGRVFLAGDAAHRNPPTGGLGMNTGIGDAYNLAWKLAQVLDGRSAADLLNSYESERRAVAEDVVRAALANATAVFELDAVLGLSPELSEAENWQRIKQVWRESPETLALRTAVEDALMQQTADFRDHNLEVGLSYAAEQCDSPDPVRIFRPSTVPGSPLPHAPLTRLGRHCSVRDLVAGGRWVLIIGARGAAWRTAASALRSSLTPAVVHIEHAHGDWLDVRCAWTKARGVSAAGAVLVRPDRYVAWRWDEVPTDPVAALADALTTTGHARSTL